jgi:hypothetical protein
VRSSPAPCYCHTRSLWLEELAAVRGDDEKETRERYARNGHPRATKINPWDSCGDDPDTSERVLSDNKLPDSATFSDIRFHSHLGLFWL